MMPFRFVPTKLNAAQVGHIQRELEAGLAAKVLADRYRVSVRTIYRIRTREGEPTTQVTVGSWMAPFAVRDEGPVQVGPWRPTAEALD